MDWDVDVVARLTVAAILGAIIGWEREMKNRSAGLRTHILVSLGSALFTILSLTAFREVGKVNDPARIAAQVVSGIGFLGAGTIIKQGVSVRGLTSAATMWVVAAIGMAAGAACYVGALVTTLLSLLTLVRLRGFEMDYGTHHRWNVSFTSPNSAECAEKLHILANELKINLINVEIQQDEESTQVSSCIGVPENVARATLLNKLLEIGVKKVEISS